MTTYQTKPQTVEAVQWRGDNEREIVAFFPKGTQFVWTSSAVFLSHQGLGSTHIDNDQWVLRTENGVYSTGSDTWFNSMYEEKP